MVKKEIEFPQILYGANLSDKFNHRVVTVKEGASTMKNTIKLTLAVLIVFTLAGCDTGLNNPGSIAGDGWDKPPAALVGTWLSSGTIPVFTINADGTGSLATGELVNWAVKGNELRLTSSGVATTVTWSVSGNTVFFGDPSSGPMAITLKSYSALGLTKPGGGESPQEALVAKWYYSQDFADTENTPYLMYEFTSDGRLLAGAAGTEAYTYTATSTTISFSISGFPFATIQYQINGTVLTLSSSTGGLQAMEGNYYKKAGSGGGGDITYTVTGNSSSSAATTTSLLFTFSTNPGTLNISDITLSGNAALGDNPTLVASGGINRTLSPIIVSATGNATVSINKTGIESGIKSVQVYLAGSGSNGTPQEALIAKWYITQETADEEYFLYMYEFTATGEIVLPGGITSMSYTATDTTITTWASGIALGAISYTINGTVLTLFDDRGLASIGSGLAPDTYYKKSDGGGISDITYTVTGDSTSTSATTTSLTFAFSADPGSITASNITLGGNASMENGAELTGSGNTRTLSSIAVSATGTAAVSISKTGIESCIKNVDVYKATVTPGIFYNTQDLDEYLATCSKNTVSNPIPIKVNIDLDLYWEDLLSVLGDNGIYVELDISDSSGMTIFDPGAAATGKDMVVSLVLPDTTTGIPDGKNVNSIFVATFENFTSLRSIAGENLETLGDLSFSNLTNLQTVDLPVLTTIGHYAFEGSGLTSITLSSNVNSWIGSYAFRNCKDLTSVILQEGLGSIGVSAFEGCTGLTSITLPQSLTILGSQSFSFCTGLRSINIPANVYGGYMAQAFSYSRNLTVTIYSNNFPSSISTIPDIFEGSTGLNLIFANSVSYFNISFNGIVSVTFPASATTIGIGSSSLTTINVDPNNTQYSSLDGVVYNKTQTELLRYPLAKTGSTFTIPSSVTSIGEGAFASSQFLTSMTIPASISSIGARAFSYGLVLTAINVDSTNAHYSSLDGVLYNKDKTTLIQFPGRASTGAFVIPAGVTTIGEGAFATAHTSITIPASVTRIESGAFSYCNSLNSVTFKGLINDSVDDFSPLTFPGNLRDVYFAPGGGIGTYTAVNPGTSSVFWTKQGGLVDITYTVTADGNSSTTSTALSFTFSEDPDILAASEITVTGNALKGSGTAVTGSGNTRTLSPITVSATGTATVSITKTGIEAGTKSVQVYLAVSSPITYTVSADGDSSTTSTALSFTFSEDPGILAASEITVTGNALKGSGAAVTGSGNTRTLSPISVSATGTASVSIDKTGIEAGVKSVQVYLAVSSPITYTVSSNGDSSTTSTALSFTFSEDPGAISESDITLIGDASMGSAELTGSGNTRTLSPIAVSATGSVSVFINKTGIEAGIKNVQVYLVSGGGNPIEGEISITVGQNYSLTIPEDGNL